MNHNCLKWKVSKDNFFERYCTGAKRSKRRFSVGAAKPGRGDKTLMEVCRESCGGCQPGMISNTYFNMILKQYKTTRTHKISNLFV